MLIFAIDDEAIALEELHSAVREALPDAEIKEFKRAAGALKEIRESEGIKWHRIVRKK